MLTSEGFKRKRYADILAENETKAKELFGADVDLSDRSPLGLFVKLLSYTAAEGNEVNEDVYNSAFYDTAEGVSLDGVGKNIGLSRIQAVKSKWNMLYEVDAGVTIPIGQVLEVNGVEFVTTETKTSTTSGELDIIVEAVEAGSHGNIAPNLDINMVTYITGVTSITNTELLLSGRNIETDSEFRSRYEVSTSKAGASTPDSIRATLLDEVPGLRTAIVVENETDEVDAAGRPPHSFECIVYGGQATDIAKVILSKKPGGIRAYGSETVIVKDLSNRDKTIGFTYATSKPIHVKITLVTNERFNSAIVDEIKLAAIKYIGGADSQLNVYAGLSMGEDVYISKLITATVNSGVGIEDVTITLSTDGTTFTANNVTIGDIEVAETSWDKVAITVV